MLGALLIGVLIGACTQGAPLESTTATPPAIAHPSPPPRVSIQGTSRGTCNRSPDVIGPVSTASQVPRGLTEIAGVAASSSGCTLAVWNRSGAYVSRDDGTSWVRVLAVTTGAHDVAVGAAEQVFILAHDELAVIRGDGTSTYRELPFAKPTQVATSGDWVIVTNQRELALSHDEGATWTRQLLPRPLTGPGAFHVDQRGTVSLAIAGASRDEPLALVRSTATSWNEAWTTSRLAQPAQPHVDAFAFARDGTLVVLDMSSPALVLVASNGGVTTAAALPSTIDLAGATVAAVHQVAAYDAHNRLLVVFMGRGPVRFTKAAPFVLINPYNDRGHWLVGDLMPTE
jgi:hypothetical protein